MAKVTQDLSASYAVPFGGRLGFGQAPALILIDFARAYFDERCSLYAAVEGALASALRIREAARRSRVPVIYTQVQYQAGGVDGGMFFRKVPALRHFLAGDPMGDWAEGLDPAEDEIVITKQYASAFFGTSLASMLKATGVDTLIITGLTTSGCVRATCIDAISFGYIPIVVADACGDRHPSPHEANLFDMNAKYGDVVSETEVIEYLSNIAARSA